MLRDPGVFDCLEEQTARNLLVKALASHGTLSWNLNDILFPFT
jgi:hypothetical protein